MARLHLPHLETPIHPSKSSWRVIFVREIPLTFLAKDNHSSFEWSGDTLLWLHTFPVSFPRVSRNQLPMSRTETAVYHTVPGWPQNSLLLGFPEHQPPVLPNSHPPLALPTTTPSSIFMLSESVLEIFQRPFKHHRVRTKSPKATAAGCTTLALAPQGQFPFCSDSLGSVLDQFGSQKVDLKVSSPSVGPPIH